MSEISTTKTLQLQAFLIPCRQVKECLSCPPRVAFREESRQSLRPACSPTVTQSRRRSSLRSLLRDYYFSSGYLERVHRKTLSHPPLRGSFTDFRDYVPPVELSLCRQSRRRVAVELTLVQTTGEGGDTLGETHNIPEL